MYFGLKFQMMEDIFFTKIIFLLKLIKPLYLIVFQMQGNN